MRIEAGDTEGVTRIWDVPEATGPDAVSLRRLARRITGELRLLEHFHPATVPVAIGGHPESDSALRITLVGSKVDGEDVTPAVLARLDADPERTLEPWAVLMEAWIRMGFFGPGLRRKYLEELAKIPGSLSPTTPSADSPSAEPTTAS